MRLSALTAGTLAVAASIASPAVADLQIGGFRDEWRPNHCYQPRPPIFLYSKQSINHDIDAYNLFIDQAQNYLSCIQNSAMDDLKKAKSIIEDGLRQNSDDMMMQVKSAKTQLELNYGPLR